MDHVDAEVLALVALGEPVAAADEAHVAVCQRCAEEVASLARAARLGREARADEILAPPAGVWARIEAELALAATTPTPVARTVPAPGASAPSAASASVPSSVPAPVPSSAPSSVPPPAVPAGRPTTDRPAPRLAPRPAPRPAGSGGGPRSAVVALRRRPLAWVATAAAAGVVVGGLGGAWVATRGGADTGTLVAEVELAALPGWDAVGHATVEVDDDGDRVLLLTVDQRTETDELREVWLLKEDVSGLVSLGLLDGDEGRFVLPAGLDLDEYPVVDVSREPVDGNPAHSGDSIVRGSLASGEIVLNY